jgi:hypothetical protein
MSLDPDIEETTLNSPLIITNPRKNRYFTSDRDSVSWLDSQITSVEPQFRTIDDSLLFSFPVTSGFSRTPGFLFFPSKISLFIPNIGPKISLNALGDEQTVSTPNGFGLFSDQYKSRLLNYSEIKSSLEVTSSSPLVQGMITELLTSMSPTPEKNARLNLSPDYTQKERRSIESLQLFSRFEGISEHQQQYQHQYHFGESKNSGEPFIQKQETLQYNLTVSFNQLNQEAVLPPLKQSTEYYPRNDNARSKTSVQPLEFRGITATSIDLRTSNESGKISMKSDLVESPRSKAYYKDFSNKFRQLSKKSSHEAESFALFELERINEHMKWKVYLELAELAKKNDDSEKVFFLLLRYYKPLLFFC